MGRNLHICHLTTTHTQSDVRIFYKECTTLAEAGYQVTFLVANGQSVYENGVEIIGLPVVYSGRLQRMRKAGKTLVVKALELDADLYHFHDPEFLRFANRLLKAGKRVVYDAHEDVPRQIMAKKWIPKLVRGFISKRFERFENKMALRLTAVVAATPFIRKRFEKIGARTVDVCNYPLLSDLGKPSPYGEKENTICYVGAITEVRGIHEMMQLMEGATFSMQLAGVFRSQKLKEQVATQPGWRNVNYIGFVGREQIRALYARSRVGLVLLHPTINYRHALPVKMFEYMAAGLPFVASDIPLWKKIIETHQCGLIADPHDPEAVQQAVEALLNHPAKAAAMGKNGRKAVEEHFNWGIEKQKLLRLYQDIFSQQAGKG